MPESKLEHLRQLDFTLSNEVNEFLRCRGPLLDALEAAQDLVQGLPDTRDARRNPLLSRLVAALSALDEGAAPNEYSSVPDGIGRALSGASTPSAEEEE